VDARGLERCVVGGKVLPALLKEVEVSLFSAGIGRTHINDRVLVGRCAATPYCAGANAAGHSTAVPEPTLVFQSELAFDR